MRNLWLLTGRMLFWLCWPALWVYLAIGQRTRVLLFNPKGEVLVVKGWLDKGHWQLPGGGLHSDEKPAAGAVRELCEELGIQLKPENLTLIGKTTLNTNGFRVKNIILLAHLTTAPELRLHATEITAARWLELSEVRDRMVDASVGQTIDLWQATQA